MSPKEQAGASTTPTTFEEFLNSSEMETTFYLGVRGSSLNSAGMEIRSNTALKLGAKAYAKKNGRNWIANVAGGFRDRQQIVVNGRRLGVVVSVTDEGPASGASTQVSAREGRDV